MRRKAAEVIAEVRRAGCILEPWGSNSSNLVVRPACRLTPELRHDIKAYKAEILRELKSDPAGGGAMT